VSNEQYGFVISGFSIAYMLCNPLWGRIVDRVGVRPSMTGAVLLWTLASVSHAVAGGVRGFLSLALIGNASAQTAGAKVECASRGIFDKGEF
jgi:MFS family permease